MANYKRMGSGAVTDMYLSILAAAADLDVGGKGPTGDDVCRVKHKSRKETNTNFLADLIFGG